MYIKALLEWYNTVKAQLVRVSITRKSLKSPPKNPGDPLAFGFIKVGHLNKDGAKHGSLLIGRQNVM